jgi:hypothetical protein
MLEFIRDNIRNACGDNGESDGSLWVKGGAFGGRSRL